MYLKLLSRLFIYNSFTCGENVFCEYNTVAFVINAFTFDVTSNINKCFNKVNYEIFAFCRNICSLPVELCYTLAYIGLNMS